ncbi:MAG: LacI family DNA-binding transcriptional regulator [Spirochaetales bacterium]|nr:LacI family DNA-binding transcriptional regulator [Spirochaetales bacterium]
MRKKGITISDIAEKTGYSKTTVSFAFNWPNRISAEAVEKIMKCARELGYHGSGDQGQEINRFKTICLLIPETQPSGHGPIWARSMMSLYTLCAEKGYMLSLIDEKRMSDSYFQRSSAVDAFLVFCPTDVDASFLDSARKRHIPVIGINLDVPEQNMIDNTKACAELVFQVIETKTAPETPSEGVCTFFEINN